MLHCQYFEANRCRSCTLIETPYSAQLLAKEARCKELLSGVDETAWLPSFTAGDRGFRNRAKLVVGGEASGPISLGILGPDGKGVDLRECAIQSPGIARVIPEIAAFIESTGLRPYDVPARKGELKFVHITESPESKLMLRFVVRSEHGLTVLRSQLDDLLRRVPLAEVVSVNLLPEHKAVLEGEREEMLVGESLPMRLGSKERPLTLHLQPQSFFQTNTGVARELYAQVAGWVAEIRPASLWDLYCGVGGFALHCADELAEEGDSACDVLGIELSPAAVESAKRSSSEAGLAARFIAADATSFALAADQSDQPELLIVNPPRRGIGEDLSHWIENSQMQWVVYSSCNPDTLKKDLALMPSYVVQQARVFDMFPHTGHLEVAVLLRRSGR